MMAIASHPLKVYGGKGYLASRIIAMMPPHVHYVEPYAGGLAVLLEKPDELIDGHSEVVNDINEELATFWWVLRSELYFDVLKRMVEATPFSQVEWELSQKAPLGGDRILRAYRFFIKARQSREGKCKDFATLSRNRTRRGMNEQASAWLSAIEGLPAVHERLKRVVILNDEAINVIRSQDGENTLFYCDPPYLHETRVSTDDYEYEMTPEQHEDLLSALSTIRGKFMVSGYRSEMYDAAAQKHGWCRTDFEIDIKASNAKKKSKRTECVWTNFEPKVTG